MRDYFADLVLQRVTGVTKGDTSSETKKSASFREDLSVTPIPTNRCDRGNKLLHVVTPLQSKVVTQRSKEKTALPVLPLVTPHDARELLHAYHERAAIMEFDGELPQTEAEKIAYIEALILFMTNCHPEILAQFDLIINQSLLN